MTVWVGFGCCAEWFPGCLVHEGFGSSFCISSVRELSPLLRALSLFFIVFRCHFPLQPTIAPWISASPQTQNLTATPRSYHRVLGSPYVPSQPQNLPTVHTRKLDSQPSLPSFLVGEKKSTLEANPETDLPLRVGTKAETRPRPFIDSWLHTKTVHDAKRPIVAIVRRKTGLPFLRASSASLSKTICK